MGQQEAGLFVLGVWEDVGYDAAQKMIDTVDATVIVGRSNALGAT